MTDSMKDRMIEAEEREGIDPDAAYDHVREAQADSADIQRKSSRITLGRALAVAEFEADVLKALDALEQISQRASIGGPEFAGHIERALSSVREARYLVDEWKEAA